MIARPGAQPHHVAEHPVFSGCKRGNLPLIWYFSRFATDHTMVIDISPLSDVEFKRSYAKNNRKSVQCMVIFIDYASELQIRHQVKKDSRKKE